METIPFTLDEESNLISLEFGPQAARMSKLIRDIDSPAAQADLSMVANRSDALGRQAVRLLVRKGLDADIDLALPAIDLLVQVGQRRLFVDELGVGLFHPRPKVCLHSGIVLGLVGGWEALSYLNKFPNDALYSAHSRYSAQLGLTIAAKRLRSLDDMLACQSELRRAAIGHFHKSESRIPRLVSLTLQ